MTIDFIPWSGTDYASQIGDFLRQFRIANEQPHRLVLVLSAMADRANGIYTPLTRRHKPRWVRVGGRWVRPGGWGFLIYKGREQPADSVGRGGFHPRTYDWPGITI